VATLSVIGILLGVFCLIYLSYRGLPSLFVAPFSALVVLLFAGRATVDGVQISYWQSIVNGLTTTYMGGFGTFAGRYFLVFMSGSVFGAIMGDSGAARSLGLKFARIAKRSKKNAKLYTVLAIVAISILLAYGGISAFVAMFTIVAVAKELFREMDVPWGMYGCNILGAGFLSMTVLPGSPSVPNIISSDSLGTTPTAAPVLGILSALFGLALGILYIIWKLRKYAKKGEGFYPTGTEIAKTITESGEDFKEIGLIPCLLPSLALVLLLNLAKQHIVVSTLAAIAIALALFWKRMPNKLDTAVRGAGIAVQSICVASMVIAFGTVVSATPGFASVIGLLDKVPGPPIVQLIISVNIAAGITGSASGGLTIALNALGQRFLDMGLNPQIIHRVSCISCGGLDSLPHNGTIINELNVTKLTHKTGYGPFGVCSVVIPIITSVFAAVLSQLGIV